MIYHAARNAILPVATAFAIAIGFLVGGQVLTEQVFSWLGPGKEMVQSALRNDHPLSQATLFLLLVIVIYKLRRPGQLWRIFRDAMKESVMILMIIAAAELFSYMMSSLFITQTLAAWIGDLEVSRWVLMGCINLFLLVAGFFLPPVAVILMTAPTLLPVVENLGFDAVWFAVVLTLNMEIGLITPPVGLNLYVINGIAPDVRLPTILWGALPFMLCMVLGIVLLCMFPEIALWLPNYLMGPTI
jgi:TRAP-type C4-dicarboxylate transport system permease large subunit